LVSTDELELPLGSIEVDPDKIRAEYDPEMVSGQGRPFSPAVSTLIHRLFIQSVAGGTG